MSTELRASLRIITPLFTGGADDAPATDGYIRAESINGLLRFWYRALHPTEAATNEFRIFGSGGEASSQSLFRLAVEECPPLHEPDAACRLDVHAPGIERWPTALAYPGYGLMDAILKSERDKHTWPAGLGVKTVRPWANPDGETNTFTLVLRFRPRARAVDVVTVVQALWALCMFGGIGARSRRGFGSVQLTALEGCDASIMEQTGIGALIAAQVDAQTLATNIRASLANIAMIDTRADAPLPGYTAFSQQTRILISPAFRTWTLALREMASSMLNWRGVGKGSSGRFRADRDLTRAFLNATHPGGAGAAIDDKNPGGLDAGIAALNNRHPQRALFGLPHPTFFAGPTRLPDEARKVHVAAQREDGTAIGRRASPLFTSVLHASDGWRVIHTYLPATFLPEHSRMLISTQNAAADVSADTRFTPLTDYLDWLSGSKRFQPPPNPRDRQDTRWTEITAPVG